MSVRLFVQLFKPTDELIVREVKCKINKVPHSSFDANKDIKCN